MALTSDPKPPTGTTPLAKRQARLAYGLLAPTLFAVSLVVVLPLLAIFWISVKPVALADLRPPTAIAREQFRGSGDDMRIEYRLRNSSQDKIVSDVVLADTIPDVVTIRGDLPAECTLDDGTLTCRVDEMEGGYNERLIIPVAADDPDLAEDVVEGSDPIVSGRGDNVLINTTFTLENFADVFDGGEFWSVLWVTLFYTFFGTIGAIILGLFAALLLDRQFRGQGILRGLFLFPYVAPIIAVAFTWIILFDPFSGSVNALLVQMGVVDNAINFFGQRPFALIMVTVFAMWGYFPLCFLFILARMQSIPEDMYEAAEMDGASPFQMFWYLSIPQLLGILSVLFLLRFIWTFNKFDDIFLLTGGNAGTRTLTVNVYEQAFAVSNIGAGAAVAVVIFFCLLLFSVFFFRFISREEGL
ncbi:sugar ABC transporter permease [Cognatiyoonia sp. IB215182]|uniref:carbohydrate ABC transporter permease n=1 Tax=Cognatiyoonia sp. IB215182 TaxID=3097353 RepID=UPI002A0FC49F|nr:sugar ABC transporter permease [Cognatiyoonia sp. IB215182]MDX8351066.1 sugar ABC transporter permease [Cognatiyoonia sp. IB215182]